MKWLKRGLWGILGILVVATVVVVILINPFGPSPLNDYPKDGQLTMEGLQKPVRVVRDEKGMAYLYADNMDDLLMTQGFVTAQDRLFQMELTRLYASGRISELIGEAGRSVDLRMRTLGFHRQAVKHFQILNDAAKNSLQKYVDGVNAFIRTRPQDIHLEFKLSGLTPQPWTPADALCILYFMGWNSAANLQHEIVGQMLVERLGAAKAAQLSPLNINPAEPGRRAQDPPAQPLPPTAWLGTELLGQLLPLFENKRLAIGSNNWVVGPTRSVSGQPILANDPHLDATMLPGPWYPCGLIMPGLRAVGVTIPGTPGIAIGRTDHVAFGVTNAYGDAQDLYVETVDPQNPAHYLEGSKSIPFELIDETLRFKDEKAPGGFRSETIQVRLTHRGPVITDVLPPLKTNQIMTVRWSAFEAMGPSLGFDQLLLARDTAQFRQALRDVNQISLNWVFADVRGNIGWQVSGRLPIRSGGGPLPYVVRDSQDNWRGWIPFAEMPQADNPPAGWVGTTNQRSVARDFPYYYSNFAASSYRQQRLIELMDDNSAKSEHDHWRYQRDIVNLKAEKLMPVMAEALKRYPDTAQLGGILLSWNCWDNAEQVGPSVFHSLFDQCALLTFEDELGKDLAGIMLRDDYYWEERFAAMLMAGDSPWFDNVNTPETETRDDVLHQAGLQVAARLTIALGGDPAKWQWGKIHHLDFYSPIARKGLARTLLGGGSYPADGSGDTLRRAKFVFNEFSNINVMASLRMVVDMGDADKVLAVLPGGVTGRQFDPHTTDQIPAYINGDEVYWWFSDQQIQAHQRHELVLKPS